MSEQLAVIGLSLSTNRNPETQLSIGLLGGLQRGEDLRARAVLLLKYHGIRFQLDDIITQLPVGASLELESCLLTWVI